jgi:hypothetical protein
LLGRTTNSSLAIQLQRGHEYAFLTTARDNVGFSEIPPIDPDMRVLYLGPPWQSPRDPFDVNDDGFVVPLDVLLIFNELNLPQISGAGGALPLPPPTLAFQKPFFDVSGDNFVTPLDGLAIINRLNQPGGESEADDISLAFDPSRARSSANSIGLRSTDDSFSSLPRPRLNSAQPRDLIGSVPNEARPTQTIVTLPRPTNTVSRDHGLFEDENWLEACPGARCGQTLDETLADIVLGRRSQQLADG